jgi:hypothetical protein
LEALSLHIRIPADYPASKCSIQVTNPEISRGFARYFGIDKLANHGEKNWIL